MTLTGKISSAIFGGREHAFISDGTDDIVFNTVLNFTETDNYQVTSHAIEDGGDVADHIEAKPKEISFSGVLTDDDWSVLDPTSFVNENVQGKFNTLDRWREEKPILTYYGHKTDIENVVLTSVIRNKSLDTGNGWGIDIGLIVVNIATIETTETGVSTSAVNKKGATAKDSATKEGAATEKKSQSLLKGVF